MRTRKRNNILMMTLVCVTVLGLGIGFAAFASNLTIKSTAQVNPDTSDFSVVFSSSAGSNTTGSVAASPVSLGESATISSTDPTTISGLKAKFTAPDQSVSYTFYARNTGQYLAYLNYITIGDKKCTAGTGTNAEMVNNACNGISISVKVGSDSAVSASTELMSTHTLGINSNETVVVTISYDKDSAMADGPFSVEFGDVTLTYSTINNYVPKACTIAKQNENKYSKGDIVTCTLSESTDKFYVIEDAELSASTIKMITEMNIHKTDYRQSNSAGTVAFSGTSYWSSETKYPADVYDNRNDIIKPIVEGYVSYLNGSLIEDATGSLLTYSQTKSLGCDVGSCSSAPTWVYSTYYWIGSAYDSSNVRTVNSNGDFYEGYYGNDGYYGVRPVITVSASDLG